ARLGQLAVDPALTAVDAATDTDPGGARRRLRARRRRSGLRERRGDLPAPHRRAPVRFSTPPTARGGRSRRRPAARLARGRAERLLAAARAKRDAGDFEAALELLVTLETAQLGSYSTAEAEHLRGQIALEQQRGGDAARLLLSAARRLTPLNAPLARETHLEALVAALWAGDL